MKVSLTPSQVPKLPENKEVPEWVLTSYEREGHLRLIVQGSGSREYSVFVTPDLVLCSCEGNRHRGYCRHVDMVRDFLFS